MPRTPKTNSFGGSPRKARVSKVREAVESWLMENSGIHTSGEIAQAVGHTVEAVRKKMANMVSDGAVVNTNPRKSPPLYQHASHYRPPTSGEPLVSRRDPICNAGMPNGSPEFWARHNARFNTPPREVSP